MSHSFKQLLEFAFMVFEKAHPAWAHKKGGLDLSDHEPTRTGRILLMDDEEMLRRMGKLMLARLGYVCETVADGDAAIFAYENAMSSGNPFVVVMLDLTIKGGMGGKETVLALKKMDPAVRAIVCSGYCVDPVLEKFTDYGFCGALPKPYQRIDLERVLMNALAG